MTLLNELLRGIFLGIGFTFGAGFFILLLVNMLTGGSSKSYSASDLLKPFEKYRGKLHQKENYEEMEVVDKIIDGLKKDEVIDDVKLYEIDSDTKLVVADNDDGPNLIKLATTYNIKKLKPITTKDDKKDDKKDK